MTQSQIKNRFFILISCLLFFTEISFFSLLHQHILYPLLCFFIIILYRYSATRLLVIPIFLLSLLSYLDHNIFGWNLIYIMPIIFLSKFFYEHLQVKYIIPYLLLIISIVIQMKILNYMNLAYYTWQSCFFTLFYNIIILKVFITIYNLLKNNFKFLQDN